MSEPAGRAAVFDLGYKRYVGRRLPQRSRYRVIAAELVRSSWRGWWRMRVWVFAAVATTLVFGALAWAGQDGPFRMLFERAEQAGLAPRSAIIAVSFAMYLRLGFVLSLTIGATTVGRDLQAGAFELYFARPVRPIDYVLGKLTGLVIIVATVVLVPPVLLAVFIALATPDGASALAAAALIPKTLLVGSVGAMAYAIAPLVLCGISSNPRHVLIAWAAVYLVGTGVFAAIALAVDVPALAAVDLSTALDTLVVALIGKPSLLGGAALPLPPWWAALLSVAAYVVLGISVIYRSVVRAERAGLGGG